MLCNHAFRSRLVVTKGHVVGLPRSHNLVARNLPEYVVPSCPVPFMSRPELLRGYLAFKTPLSMLLCAVERS
jgi:hypothetical protein